MEGRNENVYGSLNGLSGISLYGGNPRVYPVDGVSHLRQASPADVCVILYIICSLILLGHSREKGNIKIYISSWKKSTEFIWCVCYYITQANGMFLF